MKNVPTKIRKKVFVRRVTTVVETSVMITMDHIYRYPYGMTHEGGIEDGHKLDTSIHTTHTEHSC